jgi:AcrR family transcriptional regulator
MSSPERFPVEPLTPERRRQLTRSHLLAAAEQVFIARGFHGASIDEVAATAGFTKGAVYSNFKNKEDLFIALTERRWDQQMDAVRRAMADAASLDADERADLFTRLSADLLWVDRDWQLLFLEFSVYAARNADAQRELAERSRAACAALAQLLDTELRRVGARSPIPLEDLAAVYLAFFNGVALKHATNPEEGDEQMLQSAIRVLEHALDAFPRRPAVAP